jgi:multiple sugar transport system ATP-binding protein
MAKISVRNIWKQYDGKVQALRDVVFDCQDGEFFCLLGPAGAGKSTTIKCVAGIEAVDKGKIVLDDQDVTDVLPWERDLAVAFETYALYPQLTVRQNLAFPLQAPMRKAKWSVEAIDQRVDEVAQILGIAELLDRLPRQLSGGQRQRVALGRALVRKPRAYLLDEPIAHLDAKLRHRMRGELKRIQIDLGITTLYSTPDQLEALSLADHIAVLNEGHIEQVGTPDDIYHGPANMFVARFVGDPPMNMLDATVDDHGLLLHLDGQVRLATPPQLHGLLAQYTGKRIKAGIRPKDLAVVSPTAEGVNATADVGLVQILGETSVLTLQVDSAELRAKLATDKAPARGSNVGLVFDVSKCYFFDAQTEKRIASA